MTRAPEPSSQYSAESDCLFPNATAERQARREMMKEPMDEFVKREQRLSESRFGISLIAGLPFSRPFLEAVSTFHRQMEGPDQDLLAVPRLENIHMTILRGRSSIFPVDVARPVPPELDELMQAQGRRQMTWQSIKVGPDGGIRAFSAPGQWRFASRRLASAAVTALAAQYSVVVRVPQRLHVTLASLKPSASSHQLREGVQRLVNEADLPAVEVSTLRLVNFHNVGVTSARILRTYELEEQG